MSFLDWIDLQERSLSFKEGKVAIQGVPDICPHCNRKISIELKEIIEGYSKNGLSVDFFCFQCPACKEIIIGKYYQSGRIFAIFPQTQGHPSIYPEKSFVFKTFSELLNNLSPCFPILYNQSAKAEHYGCGEIAGAGYRKALEFLVKDFAISQHPEEKAKIKKTPLTNVIDEYLESRKIKEIAKRAVWLGNDETHYERKWEDKDIEDLKKLISITVNFLESDLEADAYTRAMPSGKKGETK